MIKEEKTYFSKVFVIAILVLIANAGFVFYKFGNFEGGVSGMSIKDTVEQTYESSSFSLKVFLISNWFFLFVLLFVVFVKDRGVISRKKELQGIDLKKVSVNSKTDLDTLYALLQQKNHLRVSTVAKTFGINKNTALEWCKILESGNLAEMDYPGIGEPIIKLKGTLIVKNSENAANSKVDAVKGKRKKFSKIMFIIVVFAGLGFLGYVLRGKLAELVGYMKGFIS